MAQLCIAACQAGVSLFGVKKCLPFYEGRYQVSCMGATFALFDESKTAVTNKDAFLAGSLSNFAF